MVSPKLKIAQSALDSGDVVLGFSNETYEEPKVFSTFKPSSSVSPSMPNPDLIEIDPSYIQPSVPNTNLSGIDPSPVRPDPDLIEIDPNQPEQNNR